MYNIVVSAGGTGGHIIPALNVSKELIKRGISVCFIGNKDSMEESIITKNNIVFYAINVQKIYRSFTIKHIFFPYKFLNSFMKCKKYLAAIKPKAFIGFGGFVSGAPALAANSLGIPVYLQEQNVRPGITNVITGRLARTAFLAYPESCKYFKKCKIILSGNPINKRQATNLNEESVRMKETSSGQSQGNRKLFILGGSQGSLFINELIINNLDLFNINKIDLIWQTGVSHISNINLKLADLKQNLSINITTFDFIDHINDIYNSVDYVIARGGAMSLSEIESFRLPVFIIPIESRFKNEQYYNAKNMVQKNYGFMFQQKEKKDFKTKFKAFIENADGMYTSSEQSLHLSARTTIVDAIFKDFNI